MKKKRLHQCDYPGCPSKEAKRRDIPTNWFRGDDIVMLLCKEHAKDSYKADVPKTARGEA